MKSINPKSNNAPTSTAPSWQEPNPLLILMLFCWALFSFSCCRYQLRVFSKISRPDHRASFSFSRSFSLLIWNNNLKLEKLFIIKNKLLRCPGWPVDLCYTSSPMSPVCYQIKANCAPKLHEKYIINVDKSLMKALVSQLISLTATGLQPDVKKHDWHSAAEAPSLCLSAQPI